MLFSLALPGPDGELTAPQALTGLREDPRKRKKIRKWVKGISGGEENQSPGYCIHRIQNLCTHDLALLTFDVFNF